MLSLARDVDVAQGFFETLWSLVKNRLKGGLCWDSTVTTEELLQQKSQLAWCRLRWHLCGFVQGARFLRHSLQLDYFESLKTWKSSYGGVFEKIFRGFQTIWCCCNFVPDSTKPACAPPYLQRVCVCSPPCLQEVPVQCCFCQVDPHCQLHPPLCKARWVWKGATLCVCSIDCACNVGGKGDGRVDQLACKVSPTGHSCFWSSQYCLLSVAAQNLRICIVIPHILGLLFMYFTYVGGVVVHHRE